MKFSYVPLLQLFSERKVKSPRPEWEMHDVKSGCEEQTDKEEEKIEFVDGLAHPEEVVIRNREREV